MKKEIEQNVYEVRKAFLDMSAHHPDDIREFLTAVSDEVLKLEAIQIDKYGRIAAKKIRKNLSKMLGLSDEDVNGRVDAHIQENTSSQPIW